jgi:hypothetical protein
MPKIDLPIFPLDMSLDDALAHLHEVHRSAAVVFTQGDFQIITAGAIAKARAKGLTELSKVPTGGKAIVDETGHLWLNQAASTTKRVKIGKHSINIVVPKDVGALHLDAFLQQKGFGSDVWEKVDSSVGVIANSRGGVTPSSTPLVFDDALSGRYDHPRIDILFPDVDLRQVYAVAPPDYYCDGTPQHDDFPPPNVRVGDLCPRGDGAYVISTK